jgi:hypothetical protein
LHTVTDFAISTAYSKTFANSALFYPWYLSLAWFSLQVRPVRSSQPPRSFCCLSKANGLAASALNAETILYLFNADAIKIGIYVSPLCCVLIYISNLFDRAFHQARAKLLAEVRPILSLNSVSLYKRRGLGSCSGSLHDDTLSKCLNKQDGSKALESPDFSPWIPTVLILSAVLIPAL